MKFYIIRESTNTIVQILEKENLVEASAYVYKWYGDGGDNAVDVYLATTWEELQKKGELE